jgi:Protein of unknown function (DUF2852)
MGFAATLNDIPRPLWIVGMIFGFIWWWPVGLAVLAYLLGSGRLGHFCGPGRWYNMAQAGNGGPGPRNGGGWSPWGSCGRPRGNPPPSGNAAFDEYRAATLRRLEEEQREFQAYLERLRQARDKAEFDQFMAERRNGPGPMPETP